MCPARFSSVAGPSRAVRRVVTPAPNTPARSKVARRNGRSRVGDDNPQSPCSDFFFSSRDYPHDRLPAVAVCKTIIIVRANSQRSLCVTGLGNVIVWFEWRVLMMWLEPFIIYYYFMAGRTSGDENPWKLVNRDCLYGVMIKKTTECIIWIKFYLLKMSAYWDYLCDVHSSYLWFLFTNVANRWPLLHYFITAIPSLLFCCYHYYICIAVCIQSILLLAVLFCLLANLLTLNDNNCYTYRCLTLIFNHKLA